MAFELFLTKVLSSLIPGNTISGCCSPCNEKIKFSSSKKDGHWTHYQLVIVQYVLVVDSYPYSWLTVNSQHCIIAFYSCLPTVH